MRSLGFPEGAAQSPVDGDHGLLRKIDNFLPSWLKPSIIFQKARQDSLAMSLDNPRPGF
jgi:hypothetical protein